MSEDEEKRLARVDRRKSEGKCVQCEELAVTKKTMCSRHLEIRRKRAENYLKVHGERIKERRSKRVSEGLCTDCGEPSAPGKKRCHYHLEMTNSRCRAYAKTTKGRKCQVKARGRKKEHRRQLSKKYYYGMGPGRFGFARAVSKARKHEWNLVRKEYYDLLAMGCHYCGFDVSSCGTGLDRLDNSKGYLRGNVVPCCSECNTARGDRFTPDEMRQEIGPAIRRIKLARQAPQVHPAEATHGYQHAREVL